MRKDILYATFALLAICASFVSCGSTEAPPSDRSATTSTGDDASNTIPETLTEFFITVDVTITSNELTISGDTNLPDGSIIAVDVIRLIERGYDEWNKVLAQRMVVIKNGKYNESAEISDEEWFEELLDEQFAASINEALERGGTSKSSMYMLIQNDLSITVTFSPIKFTQPENVYEVVGRNGEKLKGEQVRPSSDGTFYVLEATKSVSFPFTYEKKGTPTY
jgi:hypothetical protein